MRIEVLDEPVAEPVSLQEAKVFLRVVSADEDALVGALVAAARRQIELATGYALVEQTRRLVLDGFPPGGSPIPLPMPPLVSVTEIEYVDANGAPQVVSVDDYRVIPDGTPGLIVPTVAWPEAASHDASVRVTFTCGFGAQNAEALPEQLAVAVRQLVSHWYDNRTPVEVGTVATPVPMTVEFLTAAYRFRYHAPDHA